MHFFDILIVLQNNAISNQKRSKVNLYYSKKFEKINYLLKFNNLSCQEI